MLFKTIYQIKHSVYIIIYFKILYFCFEYKWISHLQKLTSLTLQSVHGKGRKRISSIF